ncbi:MAG: methionine adenosyltransferase [Acidobacteria bacterium]|nr:methionine adenosyltransferase [Acidobacteriota bacterium]
MATGRYLFTSESVTEGHPDKIADQISDAVLDAVLAGDPSGRVACECLLTTGLAMVAGEITTEVHLDFQAIVRKTVREIGYTDASYGFDADSCAVLEAVHQQSGDIKMGVDTGGAGDQGLMFGYACDETPELMPLPIMLAHKLTRRLAQCRHEHILNFLRPDGKSQVTVEYEGDRPMRVDTVVVSAQHSPDIAKEELERAIIDQVILPVIPAQLNHDNITFHVNPTGRFVTGGPHGDTGVTGRKIIVDTYGGVGHHGGGCFSGKDPSKVDRSASYMARYIAKNIVAAGLARRVEVQLAYAIGVALPVSVMVNTFGTGLIEEERLVAIVRNIFPLTPLGIINHLQLRRPIYKQTAAYGHFGRSEPGFSWEQPDRTAELRNAAGMSAVCR